MRMRITPKPPMLNTMGVEKLTRCIAIRLLSIRAGHSRETTIASASEAAKAISMRCMNGTEFNAALPPYYAGNQKTKLSSTDDIAAAIAPASFARFQNRPRRNMTVIPGVKNPVNS
jgi:hypothetical protein